MADITRVKMLDTVKDSHPQVVTEGGRPKVENTVSLLRIGGVYLLPSDQAENLITLGHAEATSEEVTG